ncbi:MAG TPA: hypothetical protein VMF61_05585 [Candidatus Acidoferrales bacterium]|nr:hypothetical protein [Candidatus Acidoferrales bacterium]
MKLSDAAGGYRRDSLVQKSVVSSRHATCVTSTFPHETRREVPSLQSTTTTSPQTIVRSLHASMAAT